MTGWRCRRRHVHVWSVLLSFLPDANESLASQACFRARRLVRSTCRKSRARYGTQISSNSNERSSCLLCFLFSVLSVVCQLPRGRTSTTVRWWYQGRLTSRRKFQLLLVVSSLASCFLWRGERRTTNHEPPRRRRFSFFSLRPGEPLSHLP